MFIFQGRVLTPSRPTEADVSVAMVKSPSVNVSVAMAKSPSVNVPLVEV